MSVQGFSDGLLRRKGSKNKRNSLAYVSYLVTYYLLQT